MVFGKEKSGKTRFASTLPKPIIYLGSEDGTDSIKTVEGVEFIRIVLRGGKIPEGCGFLYLDEMQKTIDELHRETYFKTVVLDTGDGLAELVLTDILGMVEIPTTKFWGMAGKEQNQQYSNQTRVYIKELLQLHRQNVVILTHEKNSREDGYGSADEMIKPTVGSNLSNAVAKCVAGTVGHTWQTFIREETVTEKAGDGVEAIIKTGKREFCLRTAPHPIFNTGSRLTVDGLPDVVVNPTWAKIAPYLEGKVKKGV